RVRRSPLGPGSTCRTLARLARRHGESALDSAPVADQSWQIPKLGRLAERRPRAATVACRRDEFGLGRRAGWKLELPQIDVTGDPLEDVRMPLYEYTCGGCGKEFEVLVRGQEKPACPSCGG